MSLMDMLSQQLKGNAMGQISRQLGTDEATAGRASEAALSTLLGALARNASQPEGARSLHRALEKDHDGGVLDNLSGFLGNAPAGSGEGILKHVLGSRRPRVEAGLSRSTGLDSDSVAKLMTMLAPVVMGALGKNRQAAGVDSEGLADMLGRERRQLETAEPQSMGVVGRLLDTDGDGDVDISDLAKHGARLFGKFLGRK